MASRDQCPDSTPRRRPDRPPSEWLTGPADLLQTRLQPWRVPLGLVRALTDEDVR